MDDRMVVILDPAKIEGGQEEDYLRANRSRERRYAFDHAFDENASQETVYQVPSLYPYIYLSPTLSSSALHFLAACASCNDTLPVFPMNFPFPLIDHLAVSQPSFFLFVQHPPWSGLIAYSLTAGATVQATTQKLLDGVMDGFNASCFAYGATGAGKTYTMLGTAANPGCMVLTVGELFERIKADDSKVYRVASHLASYSSAMRGPVLTSVMLLPGLPDVPRSV